MQTLFTSFVEWFRSEILLITTTGRANESIFLFAICQILKTCFFGAKLFVELNFILSCKCEYLFHNLLIDKAILKHFYAANKWAFRKENMQTIDIMHEIQRLPLTKKFYVLEEIIKSIKKDELNNQMEFAASELYAAYANDKDLTAFTSLDFEHFYEAK